MYLDSVSQLGGFEEFALHCWIYSAVNNCEWTVKALAPVWLAILIVAPELPLLMFLKH